jgi:hypothetical protein
MAPLEQIRRIVIQSMILKEPVPQMLRDGTGFPTIRTAPRRLSRAAVIDMTAVDISQRFLFQG